MNIRKIISAALAMAILASALCVGAAAVEGKWNGTSWSITDGVLTVSGGDIPDSTASSSPPWAKFAPSVKSVVIGSGVQVIGERAFEDMTEVTAVDLGGAAHIGRMAFSGCASLGSVALPQSVKAVSDYAFAECTALTSVTLPSGLTEMGEGVFEACPALSAFNGGGGRYTVDGGIIYDVGTASVYRCPPAAKITDYTVPFGITSVSAGAFRDCAALVSADLGDADTVGDGAFYGCASLEEISMPRVKTIGRAAFYGIAATQVTFPASLAEIGDSAFAFSTSLGKASFEGDAPSAGNGIFYGCDAGFTVVVSAASSGFGDTTWMGYPVLRHGTYSGSVGGIFWSLDSVSGVITLTGAGALPDYASPADAPWYEYRRLITGISVQSEGITAIGDNCFRYSAVTAVDLPESVTRVGAWAFSGCNYLETVTVRGKAVIGDGAFFNCVRLNRAHLRSVREIGRQAFAGCDALELVFTGASAPTLGEYAFDGTDASVLYPAGGTGYSGGEWDAVYSEAYTAGDANGDGRCNISDVSLLLKYIARWDVTVQRVSADVNCDGKLNMNDASTMLKYIAKWDIEIGLDVLP